MRIGIKEGVGCDPKSFAAACGKPDLIPDQFQHEIATAFNVRAVGSSS
jgi:7,8-dihydropterin-6-yl-methyl-4-(beta-D-ribofuranosyl)aminobenzene 5'-phosphate synthase